MTVIQPNSVKNNAKRASFGLIGIANSCLFLLCIVSALFYVVWANSAASDDYRAAQMREDLVRLTEDNSARLSQKNSIEDPASALEFAHNQHMVEAKDIVYVFENGSVALRK